ncbi:MAG: glycosyltransferase [Methanobrevibacter sp.]
MISIIIPIYNAEDSIKRAFDSLLNQTIGFENLDVIIIYDKSTNDTQKIIQDYNNRYDNVKTIFLDKNSCYAGELKNMGLTYATKEYVLFLDSDDILYEDACEVLYSEITKENCDIVSGVHTTDGINTFPDLLTNTLSDPETYLKSRIDKVNQMVDENFSLKANSIDEYESIITNQGLASKIFKKTFLNDNSITFPEKIVVEDSVFLFNAFLNASCIKFINKLIYRHHIERQVRENATVIYSKRRLLELLTAYFEMFDLSIAKDKQHIFKKYLLLDKLNNFTRFHLLKSDLSIDDLMDVLKYGTPLFELYMNYNPDFSGEFSRLFNHIANKNYEDALRCIFNFNIPNQKNIKVATILDPFSNNSFRYEFDSIAITPDSWKEQFEIEKPSLFFCESAYHGVLNENKPNGVWAGKISKNSLDNNLKDILTYCNQNNIPTIFWNKEDPISFTDKFSFTNTALKFDYIFTSCEESVEEYHHRGHKNVYPLMFAAQPRLFNPIKQDRLNDTVVFAGSWYSKFPQRCKTMEEIFDKILSKNFNLKIYDRFFSSSHEGMRFPEKYSEYINPNVEYQEIPKVYKESEFGLNFNTITDSNTMFARRVFELMASNTTVLSNYSKGVYRLFKDNVLYLDRNKFDLNRDFSKMKEENLYNVLENHTYSNRFRQILDTINFKYIPDLRHIVLFYRMDDLRMLSDIQNHFYSINYPYKHLKLITDENNSFLSNTIMEDDLKSVELKDNYYFSFANLDLNPDFIKKALLHFQYIDKNVGIMENAENKYVFNKSNNSDNVVFNESMFNDVIGGNELDIYYI